MLFLFLVTQSCLTLCGPMDCNPPGTSVHGILQERILEWVAVPSSRGSSKPRDGTQVSHIAGRFFTVWATREAPLIKAVFLKWRFPETRAYYENVHTKSDHVAKLFLEIWKLRIYLNVFMSFSPSLLPFFPLFPSLPIPLIQTHTHTHTHTHREQIYV